MKFLKYAFIVLFSVSVMSCGSSGGDDVDTVSPGITITAPTVNDEFSGGETVTVTFTATDNVALESYVASVEITKVASVASVKITPDVFTFNKTANLSGTSKEVSFGMTLPDNPEKGEYTITITVTDASTEENVNMESRVFVVS